MSLAETRRAQYSSAILGDAQDNAKVFLYAYQARMQAETGYRGKHAQEYHNWRTGWLVACLDQLPPWGYGNQLATPVVEAKRYLESRRHVHSFI